MVTIDTCDDGSVDTRQLEYFVTVAEELSFTRAAARLFAVQSSVSAGIRALESDLGTALFERSPQRVALTPAGEALLPEARAAMDAVDRVRSVAAQTSAGLRGRLRVGIFTSLASMRLPALFREFRDRYPLVELRLGASASGSTGLADDVRRGRVDLAFMGLPAIDLPGLEATHLFSSRSVAVLPVAHPLARGRRVALADIAREPFIDTPAGFGNRIVVERAFAAHGLGRTVELEVAGLPDVPPFVAAGLGVAIVPETMIDPVDGIVVLPLDEPIAWELSVITRPRPSLAATALRDLMAERYRDGGPL